MTLKEHGKAGTRSREGSQEAHEGGGCGGCRAPPKQSPTTRNPPTHIGQVGGTLDPEGSRKRVAD